MANIFDYIAWRGDLRFDFRPFNELDGLVLCRMSYLPCDNILGEAPMSLPELADALSAHPETEERLIRPDDIRLLKAAAESERFRGMLVCNYVNQIELETQTQFSALCYILEDGRRFVAFRGTDTTLVGWKEDFNMAFICPVPAQLSAVKYLERIAAGTDGALMLGGHSKGGNLAVYSAAKSSGEIQERIVAVHNNDGPGFAWDISETPGHKRIASRIHTILPQTSVVGMLMEHEKRYQVVHSTYDGLYQHDGFSWQVLGTQFVHLDDFSREGKLVDETLSSWADSLNTQQREALADALYSVFTASGAKTLSELTEEKLKSAAAMLKTYKNLDRETRRMVTEAFMLFFKLGTKNFVLDTQEEGSREIENIRKKISEQYQKLVERKK